MSQSQPPDRRATPLWQEIGKLAKQARDEDLRAAEELRKRSARRPIRKFIRIGSALIALEAALFVYLYTRQKPAAPPPVISVEPPKNCSGAVNRAYWQVVAFLSQEGHPPANLDELLPKYAAKLPSDPFSGKPLEYATDGTHFTLRCPGPTATGAR